MAKFIHCPRCSLADQPQPWRTVTGPVLSDIKTTKGFKELSTGNSEMLNFDINKMNLRRNKTQVCRGINCEVSYRGSISTVCIAYDTQILSQLNFSEPLTRNQLPGSTSPMGSRHLKLNTVKTKLLLFSNPFLLQASVFHLMGISSLQVLRPNPQRQLDTLFLSSSTVYLATKATSLQPAPPLNKLFPESSYSPLLFLPFWLKPPASLA